MNAGAGITAITERLRDPELSDDEAAELAREAAELVSEASNEIDRALRDRGGDAS